MTIYNLSLLQALQLQQQKILNTNHRLMGNQVKKVSNKIGHILSQVDQYKNCTNDGIPINPQQNIEDAAQLNKLMSKNITNLGSKLQLQTNHPIKNGVKWENSIIKGKISVKLHQNIFKSKQKSMDISKIQQNVQNDSKINKEQVQENKKKQHDHASSQINEPKQQSITKSYNIILTLKQMYELKNTLSSYDQRESQVQQRRRSAQGKLCVICLDAKPEQVLPCAHAYCAKCMQNYVINRDKVDRKCPMCRKSYQQGLQENIYQIVEWDQQFVAQMRNIYYRILQKNNMNQIKKIKKYIQLNERQLQKQQQKS